MSDMSFVQSVTPELIDWLSDLYIYNKDNDELIINCLDFAYALERHIKGEDNGR